MLFMKRLIFGGGHVQAHPPRNQQGSLFVEHDPNRRCAGDSAPCVQAGEPHLGAGGEKALLRVYLIGFGFVAATRGAACLGEARPSGLDNHCMAELKFEE